MTTRFEPAENERGSALLMSLVLIFVMTVLGLVLFDLGVVESRLVLNSQTDARAMEITQAGVERAFQKLGDQINAGDKWGSGTNAYCSGGTSSKHGCSETQFHPADSDFIPNLAFDGGTYAIEFKPVLISTLPVPCQDSGNGLCADLMFVRVTGTLSNMPPGYSRSRTIQLLAQAVPGTCLICGGITASAATGLPINGNVKIAGSIQITGIQGSTSLSLSGASRQTNSYAALDSHVPPPGGFGSLERLPQLPLVCPFGRTCSAPSDRVESLGATLKVFRPTDTQAVSLVGGANLGENGDQSYPGGTRKGKGPLDGIFVADGCTMPCTDNFSGVTLNSTTFVDDNNITKPYQGAVGSFPQLTDPWRVFGVQYAHFACVPGTSCFGAPSTSEFFVNRAANVMVSSNCTNTVGGTGCGPIMENLGSINPVTGVPPPACDSDPSSSDYINNCPALRDNTPYFETQIFFTDQNNLPKTAKICWNRPALLAALTASGITNPKALEFGDPIAVGGTPTCDTPAPSSRPLLLYFQSSKPTRTGFNIQRNGGPTDYLFRGSAIVVTNGLANIEEIWDSCLTTGVSVCQDHQFTRDSSFTLMTTGDMNLGKSASNIDRIMGLFYAGGTVTSRKQTKTIGSITGRQLCFGHADPDACGEDPSPPGGQVPSFFQVIPDANNLVTTITSGGQFTVVSYQRYWVECKRTPGITPAWETSHELCDYTR